MAKALLAAAQGGHANVVECILQKDNTLIVEKVSSDKELWKQAITEELTCVFEVCTTYWHEFILSQVSLDRVITVNLNICRSSVIWTKL